MWYVSKLFGDHHHRRQRFNGDAQTSTWNSSSFFGNYIFEICTHERVYRQLFAIDRIFPPLYVGESQTVITATGGGYQRCGNMLDFHVLQNKKFVALAAL